MEGEQHDLVANTISDGYHISVNAYRQNKDNEQR